MERNAARSSAWQALHLSLTFSRLSGTNPAYHLAAHHFFYKCILQGAIDFAELRMRSWSSGANGGAECRTFFGVAGFAPKPNF